MYEVLVIYNLTNHLLPVKVAQDFTLFVEINANENIVAIVKIMFDG